MLKNDIWEKYSKEKKLIGAKSYSTVYKVKNKLTGNYYIIKEILNTYYNKDFLNKIKNLSSENNVIINEIIETKDKIYIVHELCEYNLEEYLKTKSKHFTNEEIKEMLLQLNKCLKIMEENEIIHGNIKLSNIYINIKSNKIIYKLSYLDSIQLYNLEKIIKFSTPKSPSLTLSPEMLNNNSYFNNSDLWSLGIIIYYLNFKEFPFKGNNEFQLIKNVKDNINNIKTIQDNELNELLEMMLIIEPNERISLDDYFSFFENKKKNKEKNKENENKKEEKKKEENENKIKMKKTTKIEYENIDGPIIGIDLGRRYSCAAIIRNRNVEIIVEKRTEEKKIPSVVCFRDDDILIGRHAKNNMIQYSESTMFDSKRLIGLKFNNPSVQNIIKNWSVKVIEDINTGKPQYVIKIRNEEKKFFPEDVSSMILEYLKVLAEIDYDIKEIKKAVITVPVNFNKLQRDATIQAAKQAGFEFIKLINEPTAAAIAYEDIFKSDKEKNVLIFYLGKGSFKVSIVKIKGNDYYVLISLHEEHLGGEDFTQRLIEYVKEEIKKDYRFKVIDFSYKKDKKVINALRRIRLNAENVKIELSEFDKVDFFIDYLYGIDDFWLEIRRWKYEKLCMDLWEKCLIKVDEALKLAKLKKEEIDEIILLGGSTRTPKIKQMIKNYFNGKEPLQNINPDEVVAYGAVVSAYLDDIKIYDITTKSIGIQIGKEFSVIIPSGTVLPVNEKNIKYSRTFGLLKKHTNHQLIKIFAGNNKNVSDNEYLGKIPIKLDNDSENIKIEMSLNFNFILSVIIYEKDKINNQIEIPNIKELII